MPTFAGYTCRHRRIAGGPTNSEISKPGTMSDHDAQFATYGFFRERVQRKGPLECGFRLLYLDVGAVHHLEAGLELHRSGGVKANGCVELCFLQNKGCKQSGSVLLACLG